jgi:anti-sigma regulatory factor (Ser/Thr protein kinase)
VPDSNSSWIRQSIPPDVNAATVARRALARFGSQLVDDVVERSAVVVSEVVTNSVKHAGLTAAQPINLEIGLTPERLRIEITDDGARFEPAVVRPDRDRAVGGWGLVLVDELTDRWGVDFSRSTCVWCEFDRPGSRQPGRPSAT